jgi:hypothetical protein
MALCQKQKGREQCMHRRFPLYSPPLAVFNRRFTQLTCLLVTDLREYLCFHSLFRADGKDRYSGSRAAAGGKQQTDVSIIDWTKG